MLQDGLFDPSMPVHIRWGELPHWRQNGGLYFVTFRLSDSLPQTLLQRWKQEQRDWRRRNPKADQETLMQRSLEEQRRVERWLHKGYGSCILTDRAAKKIVNDSITHFDGDRYELGKFAVAGNHVHALLRTRLTVDLSEVLYSVKRFSATQMLKLPRVRQAFEGYRHLWQKESFDHLVRTEKSLEKICRYIEKHDEPW